MYEKTGNRVTARILIALLAVALVFTMMPLSMGKVFAAENTEVSGLLVHGDVVKELTYKDMKEMKNDEAIKAITKKEVPFHGVNKAGTVFDVTVDGVTINDLVGLAGLQPGAKLVWVMAESTGAKPGTITYTAEKIQTPDMKGNLMMFAWNMVEENNGAKVQTVVRGQFNESDINKSEWYTDVTDLTVLALEKPALTVKAGKKAAVLKWTEDATAEGFNILRATKKNGKYKKIAIVDNDDTGKTTFTDKKVKKGSTYYYKVEATADVVSNVSAAKKVKIK